MKSLLILSLILFSAVFATAQDDFSLCDSAMSQVGLKCEDIRFDQDEMANWGGDLWRTHYFTMFIKTPSNCPSMVR